MEELISKFKKAKTWQKVLFIALLPLLIAYFSPFLLAGIRQWLASVLGGDPKKELEDLENKLADNRLQEKTKEDQIKELESQKKKDVENAGKKNPVDFINDRFDPDRK